jgi:hypothetical protein
MNTFIELMVSSLNMSLNNKLSLWQILLNSNEFFDETEQQSNSLKL